MKNIVITTVRIPKDIHKWLRAFAHKNYVSMNSLIIKILKKEFENKSKSK